uniref:WAPL domain-containing protein n=1 Tax=Steinernema glaseri TaxID=37863 RepID=A0A1I8A0T0_9BILA
MHFSPIRRFLKWPTSFRRSNASPYPYPRTHTTLMVLPSVRPLEGSAQSPETPEPGKSRPPLNRAIPTIPESRSNESIMTQASERREDSYLDLPTTSSQPLVLNGSTAEHQPALQMQNGSAASAKPEKSLVIENRMAQNLAAKTATREVRDHVVSASSVSSSSSKTNAKTNRPEPPKSPLISVAHSVRSRLTKLGNRFGNKSDSSRSSIRGSASLMSMRNSCEPSTSRMMKSTSMDGKPNAKASAIPIRTTAVVNRASAPKTTVTAPSTSLRVQSVAAPKQKSPSIERLSEKAEQKQEPPPVVEEKKLGVDVEEMDTGQSPEVESVPILTPPVTPEQIKAKENLNPIPTSKKETTSKKTSMLIPSSKMTARMTTAFLAKTNKKPKAETEKQTQSTKRKSLEPKETTPVASTKSNRTLSLPLKKSENHDRCPSPDRHSDPNGMKLMKKLERSFIPLMKSSPRVSNVHSIRSVKPVSDREAPLAECESSRVENSPAVEFPPVNFERLGSSPGAKRRQRKAEIQETILEEDANGNVQLQAAASAPSSDPSDESSYMKLISPATTSASADTHRGLIDDEIKDQPMLIGNSFALIDDIDSSTSGRSSRRKRQSDIFDDDDDDPEEVDAACGNVVNGNDEDGNPPMPQGLDYELDTVEEQLAMISLSSSLYDDEKSVVKRKETRFAEMKKTSQCILAILECFVNKRFNVPLGTCPLALSLCVSHILDSSKFLQVVVTG